MAIIRELDSGYKFRVLRGFPGEGTLYLDVPFAEGQTIEFGDPVGLDSQSKLVKVADATQLFGFAYGDTSVPNNVGSGKITVLLGSFVAETSKYNTASTYAPGDPLTVKNGVLDKADTSAGDKVIGKVIKVDTANQKLTFVYIPEV
jgi:hypothetical protein